MFNSKVIDFSLNACNRTVLKYLEAKRVKVIIMFITLTEVKIVSNKVSCLVKKIFMGLKCP